MQWKKGNTSVLIKTVQAFMSLALLVQPVIAAADESGPEVLAAHFMAQLYDVEPAGVTVTTLSATPQSAVVQAKALGGHLCRFEMAPAPAEYRGKSSWLVAGLECDHRNS